jgi:hypothetical protein
MVISFSQNMESRIKENKFKQAEGENGRKGRKYRKERIAQRKGKEQKFVGY